MKKRLLFYKIRQYFEHKNALVITGMRQVGKTVLLRQIYDSIPYNTKVWFDFDNPLDQKLFEDIEYRNIFERLKKAAHAKTGEQLFVFIDEIQNFPEITKIVKFLIDTYRVKFFVTGSSNFYLRNLFPESLAGRKFLYELSPLLFQEFLYFHDQISLEEALKKNIDNALRPAALHEIKKREEKYQIFLEYGGFPEVVVTEESATKEQILKNIFASFFEKDIQLLSDHTDVRELRDLILLLAPRIGSQIDISKLASELGVDRGKIYGYLEFLQGIFFLRLLPRFSKSIDRQVAGGKKVYFSDNGMLHIIGGLHRAQLLENSIVNQLADYGKDLSFYYKRNSHEVDLILDKKIALEIKSKASVSDIKKVEKISQSIGIEKSFVISQTPADLPKLLSPMFL